MGGTPDFVVASNVAKISNLATDSIYQHSAVVPSDYVVKCTLGTPTNSAANHGYGPAARCDAIGDQYYRVVGSQSGYQLVKKVTGVITPLLSGTGAVFADLSQLGLMVQFNTATLMNLLSLTLNDVVFASISDGDLLTGGAGIAFSGTDVAGGSVTAWSVSDLSGGGAIRRHGMSEGGRPVNPGNGSSLFKRALSGLFVPRRIPLGVCRVG